MNIKSITLPELAEGEIYAGILIKDDTPSHHVILLPGEAESVTWKAAGEWAASVGGELPTCKEQALLFANAVEHFQPRWYWSGEQYSRHYARSQYFSNGYQDDYDKGYEARARAVRRVPITDDGEVAARLSITGTVVELGYLGDGVGDATDYGLVLDAGDGQRITISGMTADQARSIKQLLFEGAVISIDKAAS